MKNQIQLLKEALAENILPRSKFKNKPIGCPFYKKMKPEIQENFTPEEAYKAFYLGFIGNDNQKGSIIENSKNK